MAHGSTLHVKRLTGSIGRLTYAVKTGQRAREEHILYKGWKEGEEGVLLRRKYQFSKYICIGGGPCS